MPEEIKTEHRETEWKKIAGMRDKMIHAYFGVDYELVWDAIKTKIPELKKVIKSILQRTDIK